MPNELKPCPFCGGKAKLQNKTESVGMGEVGTFYFVKCTECGAKSREFSRLDAESKAGQIMLALIFWDRRSDNGNAR